MHSQKVIAGYSYNKAFTLVELLAAISIIALLLAVLMSALSKARAIGKSVQCAAQVKQFCLATYAYVADNQGCLPFYGLDSESDNENDHGGPFWFDMLAPCFGNQNRMIKSQIFINPVLQLANIYMQAG